MGQLRPVGGHGIQAVHDPFHAGLVGNLFPGQYDVLILGITETGARILVPDWTMNPIGNWWFSLAAAFLFTALAWAVTERITAPRLGEWKGGGANWIETAIGLFAQPHIIPARLETFSLWKEDYVQAYRKGHRAYPKLRLLALQTVAHGDARVGRGTLSRFVAAYQSVKPLQLGELWAIPIMLRLALIENLRRVAVLIAAGRNDTTRGAWSAALDSPFEVVCALRPDGIGTPPMLVSLVASPPAATALPALNPNQPTQSNPVPIRLYTTLCGKIGSRG